MPENKEEKVSEDEEIELNDLKPRGILPKKIKKQEPLNSDEEFEN